VVSDRRKAAAQRYRVPGMHTQSLVGLIRVGKCRTVAEVGVHKCYSSEMVLSTCAEQLDAYHLIDPWRSYAVEGAVGEDRVGCEIGHVIDWEGDFQHALRFGAQYPEIVHVWRLPSVWAAKLFEPESLDLVYIDGNHSYRSVKDDIRAWLPIVRTGGILAGHDYEPQYLGVIRAVDELLEDVWFLPDTVWYVRK